jgi:hypothetical protein
MNLSWVQIASISFIIFCGICFVVSRVSLHKKNANPSEDEILKKSLRMSTSEFAKFREIRDKNPAYLGKKN